MAEQIPGMAWTTWREAAAVVRAWPNLRRTLTAALLVGTVLFAINQLDVIIGHHATATTYVKVGLTYIVPLCVANYGLLIATKRRIV